MPKSPQEIAQFTNSTLPEEEANNRLHDIGVLNLILSSAGLISGSFLSILTIDMKIVGRKRLQIAGFTILTLLFSVIGFGFYSLSPRALFALFCFCNLFSNWGPNTTTFIVPGETFPTRFRSTAYGISAAAGKLGAIISQVLFGPLKDRDGKDNWVNRLMEIYAVFLYEYNFARSLIIQVCWDIHIHAYPGYEWQSTRRQEPDRSSQIKLN